MANISFCRVQDFYFATRGSCDGNGNENVCLLILTTKDDKFEFYCHRIPLSQLNSITQILQGLVK